MNVLTVSYKVPRGEETGGALRRVVAALAAAGEADGPIEFSLVEGASGVKSVADALVRAHPEFAPFVSNMGNQPGLEGRKIVSSGANPGAIMPTASMLHDIADGIPGRFPFQNASFHRKTSLLGEARPGFPEPAISIVSRGFPGRKRELLVTATVVATDGVRSTADLPQAVRSFLSSLGHVSKEQAVAVVPRDQIKSTAPAQSALGSAFERGISKFADRLKSVDLVPVASAGTAPTAVSLPVAKEIRDALKPLGYRAEKSARGVVVVEKTIDGWTLGVEVDRGTWSQHFIAQWYAQHGALRKSIDLPLASDRRLQTPQVDKDNVRAICTNLAAVVATVEDSVLTEMRAIKAGSEPGAST